MNITHYIVPDAGILLLEWVFIAAIPEAGSFFIELCFIWIGKLTGITALNYFQDLARKVLLVFANHRPQEPPTLKILENICYKNWNENIILLFSICYSVEAA